MMKAIRRVSQTLAFFAVYLICAYGYMTEKGFVLLDGVPTLVKSATAAENSFSQKVNGNVMIGEKWIRSIGDTNAPLTLYIYSSMICSHCNDFHRFVLPKIKRDFVEKGLLRYILVQFPLDAKSMEASKLAYCLPSEKYEDFITKLYQKRDWAFSNNTDTLDKYASEFGLTAQQIKSCKEDKRLNSDILLTRDNGIRTFGISGTPSFIVESKNGKELIIGSRSYEDFRDYFNNLLKEKK